MNEIRGAAAAKGGLSVGPKDARLLVLLGLGAVLIFALVTGEAGVRLLGLLVAVPLYFLPSYLAWKKKHAQAPAIIALNVFLGWAFVGWVGALVWAMIDPKG